MIAIKTLETLGKMLKYVKKPYNFSQEEKKILIEEFEAEITMLERERETSLKIMNDLIP